MDQTYQADCQIIKKAGELAINSMDKKNSKNIESLILLHRQGNIIIDVLNRNLKNENFFLEFTEILSDITNAFLLIMDGLTIIRNGSLPNPNIYRKYKTKKNFCLS